MKSTLITIIIFQFLISCDSRLDGISPLSEDTSAISDISDYEDTNLAFPSFVCRKYNLSLSEENDNTDIFFPDNKTERFYLIIVLQGSDLPKENYHRISELICQRGFIVAVTDHYKESFSGRHLYSEENATNMIYQKIVDLSNDKENILYGRIIEDRFILLGHSYGAGCGLFMISNECKWPFCSDSYERPYQLSGGIFYGVSLKSPFGETYYNINNEDIPILLMAGDNDGVIKYEYAEKSYDYIMGGPKIFVLIKGANHYAINNTNPPAGADADKNIQTLNQEIGLNIIADIGASFIYEYVLKSDKYRGIFDRYIREYKDFIYIKRSQ